MPQQFCWGNFLPAALPGASSLPLDCLPDASSKLSCSPCSGVPSSQTLRLCSSVVRGRQVRLLAARSVKSASRSRACAAAALRLGEAGQSSGACSSRVSSVLHLSVHLHAFCQLARACKHSLQEGPPHRINHARCILWRGRRCGSRSRGLCRAAQWPAPPAALQPAAKAMLHHVQQALGIPAICGQSVPRHIIHSVMRY